MSFTIIQNVSCLVCNSNNEISSTKNIFKTAFAQTGESLASFVAATLSLTVENLPSCYLCIHCLNLFGKLEEAQKQVKCIKYEIHKLFQNSYDNGLYSDRTIRTNRKEDSIHSQISIMKLKPVISQCVQNRRTSVLVKKETINKSNSCSTVSTNAETKNKNVIKILNDRSGHKLLMLKSHKQSLESNNILSQSQMKINLNSKPLSLDHNVVGVVPSLEDHQYSQLPTAKRALISGIPLSMQQKISMENNTYEKKKDTLIALKKNQKLNCKNNSYTCQKCGKVYKSQKALKIHTNVHDGISMYTCTICNKCFTQKAALKRHLPVHTGGKPYECQMCSKKFVYPSSFRMHTLSHSLDRTYKCDLCPIAFMSKSHLRRHMRIHTGEKQHRCEICGKSFFERYHVIAHMKIHDPELNRLKEAKRKQKRVMQRRCERCKIDFATMGEYNVHLHSHTPENIIP